MVKGCSSCNVPGVLRTKILQPLPPATKFHSVRTFLSFNFKHRAAHTRRSVALKETVYESICGDGGPAAEE